MSFKTFCLIIIIAVSGTFIYYKAQTLTADDSNFNQTTRFSLGRHPVARLILSLHHDGDARAEYLTGTSPIVVEIVQPNGIAVSDKVIQGITDMVQVTTGRKVSLFDVDSIKAGTLTDADISDIVGSTKRHSTPGQPDLFIIYAEDFQTTTDEVAKTYKEFGMVISHRRLKDLTQDYPAALEQYQISTIMHEYGHQLGLGHNTKTECIMNKDVESPQHAVPYGGSYTPVQYCGFELDQLQNIKNKLAQP